MEFKEARRVLFNLSEMFQLYLAVAVAIIGMMTGMAAWGSGVLPAGGPWPDWATFAIIMALALLSVLASGVTLFRGASTREKIQENNDLLKEILAGQKEILAGQKEIIRLLKAYAPAVAAAAGAPPPSTAAGGGGRGGEGRIEALEGEVGRLRAEIEALKGGPGGIRR